MPLPTPVTIASVGKIAAIGVCSLVSVVFNTADCQASCAALCARGVRCDDPVVFPGFVTYCSFYDPFGNRLQLCSAPPEE